jgi:Na+-driven multidrug efflux pump
MGKPIPGVWISLIRLAALYLPLALIADRFFGVTGIFAAYTVANIITGLTAYAWARSAVQSQVDKHGPRIMASETV